MCSVIVLRRPAHAWPLILGANRDEMADRPWEPPARHWPDRANVVAGLDKLAGGAWMGLNDYGVVAVVLNRRNTLGPQEGKRSRGELVLEALDHADADVAASALAHLNIDAYRPFNMVVADNRTAFWLRNRGGEGPGHVEVAALPPGLSMITAHDRNSTESSRIRAYLPRFQAVAQPDPSAGDFADWEKLLGSRLHNAEDGPRGAMTVVTDGPFGTVCSSILALPASATPPRKPIWRFAPGRPDTIPFETLPL